MKDPRTVAREIPGIFDIIFPQLTSGVVSYFNKKIVAYNVLTSVSDELVKASTLNRAMLFETAYARGEQILSGKQDADWVNCLEVANHRQRRHFDAKLPDVLLEADIIVAELVGKNLAYMLNQIEEETVSRQRLLRSPEIPGFQWIASGQGDFSIGEKLIEVKCTAKNFGSADYRQILIYWLLSYASAIEHHTQEWKSCILINPRLNSMVNIDFDEIVEVTAAGKSKIEVLQLFSAIVSDYALKELSEFRL